MAHKKAGGSSRNGRDSQSKRLGVKKFGGETRRRRQHHRAPARHQILSGPECRHRQGPYPVRAYRRPRRVSRRQAGPQVRLRRHADYQRSGIGTVEKGLFREGRPKVLGAGPSEGGVASSPFSFVSLTKRVAGPKPNRGRAGAAKRKGRQMFARTPRLLLRPGWREDAPALFRAIADERIVRNLATAPWPYTLGGRRDLPDARAPAARARLPDLPAQRRRAAARRRHRLRPQARRCRARVRLLDRQALLGPRHRHRGRPGADRQCPRYASAARGSRPAISSTIRPRAGCSQARLPPDRRHQAAPQRRPQRRGAVPRVRARARRRGGREPVACSMAA